MERTPIRESLLQSLLSQPTAPFRERHVLRRIISALDEGGVPWFQDPTGNLVVGVASKAQYLRMLRTKPTAAEGPLRVFIAHMDHPGFHGTRWRSERELEFEWFGGSPVNDLLGSRVWLASAEGPLGQGEVIEATLASHGKAISTGVVRVDHAPESPSDDGDLKAEAIYGGFSFREPMWSDGPLIYTQAADDLVGCFAIVSLALDLFSRDGRKKRRGPPPFIGLLTRAEEVGFIGTIGHLEEGWLESAKRPVLVVSLETSRQLPGAEIGKGPVVRLGDRYTVFDAGSLRVFAELAERARPGAHQKRVMDGGTCEATAAMVYGLPCVGISVPLGNYHNQSIEGGPDARGSMGPAPEFVHREDLAGLLELCHGLLTPKLAWADPFGARRKEFQRSLKQSKKLLSSKHWGGA